MTAPVLVWLVRHAEVSSYDGDHGLTERGEAQARAAAAELAGEVGLGEVELRHAPSRRASGTAEQLGAALRERGVRVGEAKVDPGFENFRVEIDGEVGPHDRVRPALARAGAPASGPRPAWAEEAARFVAVHEGGGDPIGWWLTQPTLALEPAALVVRRFWRALSLVAAGGVPRAVVCTHSGPMRALAAHALGRDAGEPEHVEAIRIRLESAGAHAELGYRGEVVALAVPRLEEPAWT